jgi:hypothetical protein
MSHVGFKCCRIRRAWQRYRFAVIVSFALGEVRLTTPANQGRQGGRRGRMAPPAGGEVGGRTEGLQLQQQRLPVVHHRQGAQQMVIGGGLHRRQSRLSACLPFGHQGLQHVLGFHGWAVKVQDVWNVRHGLCQWRSAWARRVIGRLESQLEPLLCLPLASGGTPGGSRCSTVPHRVHGPWDGWPSPGGGM